MPPDREQLLRKQIAEAFRQSSKRIDREVAAALSTSHEYIHSFESTELAVVFANIFHTLIDLQSFVGFSVPLTHNVLSMDVRVSPPSLAVRSVLHIHSPIRAFISVDYDLENEPSTPGTLRLVDNSLRVREDTARFDLVAKGILRAIDLKSLIRAELRDPANIIRKTLPHRLRDYGFAGEIDTVRLEIGGEGALHVHLTARTGAAQPLPASPPGAPND